MEVHTIHFETVESTNTWLKNQAGSFDPNKITCLIADIQTAGRGCFDKKWVSKKGNLQMSIFFHIARDYPLLPYVAQLFALSTAQVLMREKIPLCIKWPNDILVGGKKLCGILAETIQFDATLGVVIGLGLNANAPVVTDQPTTSLFELTGETWDLNALSTQIIAQFQEDLKLQLSEFQEKLSKLMSGSTTKSG